MIALGTEYRHAGVDVEEFFFFVDRFSGEECALNARNAGGSSFKIVEPAFGFDFQTVVGDLHDLVVFFHGAA